jgi:hypothetical protein
MGPRLGLDLAWYIRGGFGSMHGIDPSNGSAVYDYLTHGWKDSAGQYGGFFTAYSYELHSPPLYPPQYISDVSWLLSFIHAANVDDGGQRAKVFVRLVAVDNFDPTLLGTLEDFLQRLGPASQNPAVAGIGFRGAQEGIYEGGGTCCGGPEGPNFIGANISYGITGMDSFPQNLTQWDQMWSSMQQVANAYGYPLGISTSLSAIDTYYGQAKVDDVAQWFVEDTGYGACGQSDTTGQCTYNTWYSKVAKPPVDSAVALGVVGGEWDQNWFVLDNPPYYMTQVQIQAMFHGFADGYAKNPRAGQYMFIYGMPYLTNDDSNWVNSSGPCPYMAWFLQYAEQYGFFTDFSSPAPAGQPGGGTTQPVSRIPTGLYIHIVGDPNLNSRRAGYTQTDPVYCCGNDTFSIDGQLISLETSQGVPSATINIMAFNFTSCKWQVFATVITNQEGFYGYPNGGGTLAPSLVFSSPDLPNTGRNQAYFYPSYAGSNEFGPSNGVLEDLPVIA